jgi:hypothetical protein
MFPVAVLGLTCMFAETLAQNPYQNGPQNPYGPNPYAHREPATKIWSGAMLNNELQTLKGRLRKGGAIPNTPVDAKLLSQVNLARGEKGINLGLLRYADKLAWPTALKQAPFAADRNTIEKTLPDAANQARKGPAVQSATEPLRLAAKRLSRRLDDQVGELTPIQFMEARRFLTQMQVAIDELHDPDVTTLFELQEQLIRCKTLAGLIAFMTEEKLEFGPCVAEGRTAYQDLHRILRDTAERK